MQKDALATQRTQAESGNREQVQLGRAKAPECLRSIEDASRRLAVSPFTTRRLIKSGHLRAVRISKRVLVSESEIDRVIAQGCGKHSLRPSE
jgi:excisionase family DNA binding protein